MGSVSENIKKLRKEKGWTQVRLSMEAHVSQQAISFIESGRNEPSAEMIRALSKALGVTSAEIIGDSVSDENSTFTQVEIRLLRILDQLNEAGQDFLLSQAESILNQPVFRKENSMSYAE